MSARSSKDNKRCNPPKTQSVLPAAARDTDVSAAVPPDYRNSRNWLSRHRRIILVEEDKHFGLIGFLLNDHNRLWWG